MGNVPYGKVWGLLVDGSYEPGLPPAEPHPLSVRTGDPRVDLQAALAMLAPEWGLRQLIDISDEQARMDLARVSVMALSFVAQSARGVGRPPISQREVDKAGSIPERFLIRWRGEADPRHVKAIDAYWISAAEHGMNASTFTARVIASTGADVAAALSGAVGALSGPLHGGAPSRVLAMLDEVEAVGRRRALGGARPRPRRSPDGVRAPRLPRRGPACPRASPHRPRDRGAALGGWRRGSRGRRSRSCARASRTVCSPRTWSSGRRRPRLRGRAARAVHPDVRARAWAAGPRTSSSRSARGG